MYNFSNMILIDRINKDRLCSKVKSEVKIKPRLEADKRIYKSFENTRINFFQSNTIIFMFILFSLKIIHTY